MTNYWKIFRDETIRIGLEFPDKDAVLRELVDLAASTQVVEKGRAGEVLEALRAREQMGSTGVGRGVALPHVKHEAVTETLGVLAISSRPIDYGAVDGEGCDVFFMLLSPPDHAERHLEILRWIAGLVRDPDFPRFLRGATSVEEVRQLLREMAG